MIELILMMLGVCSVGAVIQTVTGFGFGIFVMTLLPFFMPSYIMSSAVSSCLSMTMNIYNAFRLRKDAQFQLMPVPLIAYAISSYICISLSLTQTDANLKRMLGMFLVLISLYFIFLSKKITIKPTLFNGFLVGFISGGISGMFGAGGGPPMVIYFMATTPTMAAYLATNQTFFAISGIYSTYARFAKGIITPEVGVFWIVGLLALGVGTLIGRKIQNKIDDVILRKLVYAYIAFSGIVMAVTA